MTTGRNKFPTTCTACKRPLKAGEGILHGKVSETSRWEVTCADSPSCAAHEARSPSPSRPDALPVSERATEKQWAFFEKLVPDDKDARHILQSRLGAKMAHSSYVSKAMMSEAIKIAKCEEVGA